MTDAQAVAIMAAIGVAGEKIEAEIHALRGDLDKSGHDWPDFQVTGDLIFMRRARILLRAVQEIPQESA